MALKDHTAANMTPVDTAKVEAALEVYLDDYLTQRKPTLTESYLYINTLDVREELVKNNDIKLDIQRITTKNLFELIFTVLDKNLSPNGIVVTRKIMEGSPSRIMLSW